MMEAFWNNDADKAGRIVSELLWKTISYNDYHEDYPAVKADTSDFRGRNPCARFYHAFLAGAFVGIGYEVESNKEKGLGRPDILLKDDDNRRAIIIEAKKSDKEADLDKDLDEAFDQFFTEKYAEGLYGYEQILCYGIAFFQKQARVKILIK